MIVEHQLTIVDVAPFERIYARWRWVAFWSVLGAIGFVEAIDHPSKAMRISVDGRVLWERTRYSCLFCDQPTIAPDPFCSERCRSSFGDCICCGQLISGVPGETPDPPYCSPYCREVHKEEGRR